MVESCVEKLSNIPSYRSRRITLLQRLPFLVSWIQSLALLLADYELVTHAICSKMYAGQRFGPPDGGGHSTH